jgi:lipid A 3-O-deacylase
MILAAIALVAFLLPRVAAQDIPAAGDHEWQIWAAGGHGTNGITQHTGVAYAGFRYGWILTNPIGPGFLRGQFEYGVDAVPAFLVFQKVNNAYGAGFDPLCLIWNFSAHGKLMPYAELTGGTLFTNKEVPAGVNPVNFTSTGGVGLRFLTGKWNWSADLRFTHISDAGLTAVNPGVNTLQLRIGLGRFSIHHH